MSGYQSFAHRYREVAIKTSNPLQLVVMLYDAAICSIKEAQDYMERRDIAGRSRSINKCTAIISQLQSCLDLKAGGEIASSLNRLYDYMKRRIFRANVEQSSQPLIEIEALLDNLRSAWRELVGQTQRTAAQPVGQEFPSRDIPEASAPATAMQPKSFNVSV